MRRRAKFSFVTHWREQYAHGEITIDQLEVLVTAALRAERLPKRPKADCSPRAITAAKAANYTMGVSAVAGQWVHGMHVHEATGDDVA